MKNNHRRPMTACERGIWIDTEGAIMARTWPRTTYEISVYQNERGPLEDYRLGAERDGIPCSIERFYHAWQASI